MNNIILPPPATAKPAEAEETEKLYTLFREYYDAYAAERARLDRCERMYRGDHWGDIPQKDAGEPRPVTPIIQSTVENVRADLIDYLPEAIISADSREYDELAELMTRIIRENHLRCAYDDEYAKLTHDLLVGGYSVQQVGFDPDANGGIGGAYIKHVDNRTVMFDPLCSDLQDSRAVFKFTHHTRDWFMQHYPKQAAELREDGFMLDTATDEIISPAFSKSILLIECWLREYDSKAGKHRVHMVKLAGGMKLEDSRRVKKEGYFAHGEYPFVVTTLFERKGSCLGYGFVDMFCTAPLPSYMLQYISEMRNSIKEESGANEFARGMTHAGVTSGTAIAALQEASSKRSRMAARSIHAAFRKAVSQELEVEREFALSKRCFRELSSITGDMGIDLGRIKAIDDAVKSMKNLPAEFRVTVKVVKENAFSVINNNDTVFRLVEAGMITPEVGLQLLIFDGKDQAIELMKLAPASRT